jgi:hypothetical protein
MKQFVNKSTKNKHNQRERISENESARTNQRERISENESTNATKLARRPSLKGAVPSGSVFGVPNSVFV